MKSLNTIPVLQKSIAVVERIAAGTGGITAKVLSVELGLAPATCYRILRTLVRANWLREDGHGGYVLAFGLMRVTKSLRPQERLLTLLQAPLRHLTAATGVSAKISIREGNQAVTAIRSDAWKLNCISSPVGARMHLVEAGSAGVMLMATLSQEEFDRILETVPPGYWDRHSRESLLEDVREAAEHGFARSYGKANPSIYAISMPLDLPPIDSAVVTIVGWPDEFEGGRDTKLLKEMQKFCAMAREITVLEFPARAV